MDFAVQTHGRSRQRPVDGVARRHAARLLTRQELNVSVAQTVDVRPTSYTP